MTSLGVKLSAGTAISLVVILVGIFYPRNSDDVLKKRLDSVLSGLLRAEKKVTIGPEPRVAVGFGACVDMLVDAFELLDNAGAKPPDVPRHFNQINSKGELEQLFAYFLGHGAAAERYVNNQTLWADLIHIAKQISKRKPVIGGNAPVMAQRFAMEGYKVLLAAQMTVNLTKELKSDVEVTGTDLMEDDIHLLMEYKKGGSWGTFKSPRANRLIIHSDRNNPTLKSVDNFAEHVRRFSPSLVAVGGIQMLDNFPFENGERQKNLGKLQDFLADLPESTRVHFEMASFAEEDCMKDVVDNVVYYADSLGMNEQELPNLHSILVNGTITLVSDSYPRIANVLDQMRIVYRALQKTPRTGGRRPLTRLHVHTLAYQAILTTKGSPWKNTMSAAAKAALTANRHVCGSKYIHTKKARIIMDDSFSTSRSEGSPRIPFKEDRPVSCWDEEDFNICIAPVLVCTDVVQTSGGGDNVSSAGLVLQI